MGGTLQRLDTAGQGVEEMGKEWQREQKGRRTINYTHKIQRNFEIISSCFYVGENKRSSGKK
jgi:hypothetical protein